jgi:phosphoglucosamine mutase
MSEVKSNSSKKNSTVSADINVRSNSTLEKRLFGTDGVRGTAGLFPITPDIILKLGQALGYVLRKKEEMPKVVIGKDTRLSGYMVEQCLAAGLNSMGVHVQLVGPLPTPGIGFLATNMRADAGIVISASHNPYHDNGIKIFGSDGYKISDAMELEIEALVLDQDMTKLLKSHDQIGRTKRIDDALGRYLVFVKNTFPLNLDLVGLRIVLDCANGAAYKVAPLVFEELGAEVILLGNKPDGFNVNKKSGALHPEYVAEAVKKYRADIGICLDGDADRVIISDENGEVVNGDRILAICALQMKDEGRLKDNTVVATHMSNIGLDQFLKKHGIKVLRVGVGDKYVMEAMRAKGYTLGGEQSGHIIFLDYSTTGDGLIAALKLLEVSLKQNKKVSDLTQAMIDSPQVLKNLRISHRVPLEQVPGYFEMVSKIEKKIGEAGRMFIRYSGTEPLIRVLVEAPDAALAEECCTSMIDWFKKNLDV